MRARTSSEQSGASRHSCGGYVYILAGALQDVPVRFPFSSHTGGIMGVVHVCCVICVHEPKQNIILWSYFGLLLLYCYCCSALAPPLPRRIACLDACLDAPRRKPRHFTLTDHGVRLDTLYAALRCLYAYTLRFLYAGFTQALRRLYAGFTQGSNPLR